MKVRLPKFPCCLSPLTRCCPVDLGVFRNPRYPLGKPYLKEYWKRVPISEPEEDVDSRNTLYMLRGQIMLSILYPHDPKLREM